MVVSGQWSILMAKISGAYMEGTSIQSHWASSSRRLDLMGWTILSYLSLKVDGGGVVGIGTGTASTMIC
jgi:hypothetical protein